jgi:D-galactarolactone cycloisomerase
MNDSVDALSAPSLLRIRKVEPLALEVPLAKPVSTPMMTVRSLVSLLVAVTDEDGVEGWGEIWCNFPRFGIHHRARLLKEVFAPWLVGTSFASPTHAWSRLNAASNILRLQSGEPGPIAAVIAGIDIALHDIAAQKVGLPLWRVLGGSSGKVSVYASLGRGLNALQTTECWLEKGMRAFKLHSDGDIADHVAAVRPLRRLLGPALELMLDVNSSWDPEAAIATIGQLGEDGLSWLEEPIPVDAPAETWCRLARAAPMPLAGGENMLSIAAFDDALAAGVVRVLQPDITKWGGFSGGLPLARRIVAAGRRLCPHMFSGAAGLLASAHLLAASGSRDGLLEFSVAHNPARDEILGLEVRDGFLDLGDTPGLGLRVERKRLEKYVLPT